MNNEVIGLGEPPREGLRDRVLILRSLDVFEGVDDEGLLLVAEHARQTFYRAGDAITVEGDAQRAIYVIVDGEVELRRRGKPSRTVPSGSPFGFLGLLARQPAAGSVAMTDTRMLEVPIAAFETALDENYSLLRNALRVIGGLVLKSRGNLPADPNHPPTVDVGTYYEEPRTLVERLIDVRASPFGYMNVEALIDLARNMTEIRYKAGDVIWKRGDVSTHSYHIDYGRVRCVTPDGTSVEVGRGFTLGVVDVWGAQLRAYDVHAETDVIGFAVDFESFLSLLESHVEVGIDVLRGFARSLMETLDRD